jgi:BAAT / Acyl-CoA thioester hydrolase C terminal/Acyl-CoA thioester hydrolase/BAAT N-terminal region
MQNRIAGMVAILLSWLICANCNVVAADNEKRVTFVVSPNPALMDDRVTIVVMGLTPNRSVEIRARSKDQRARWWRSSALFLARQDGSIDLSAQAPVSGAYAGVDAMGLFWSMDPDTSERPVPAFFSVVDWFKPIVTEIEAASGVRVLGTTQVVRHFTSAGVRAEPFRSNGAVGILYRPNDNRKRRGVILLGGSEGGFPTPEGPMLASRGFVTLALAYFGADGLPAAMQRIPIEYFGKAIHSMQSLPGVESAGVTIIGGSRGAEAALIVGSLYPEINGVAGVSSSHVRWEGATARELPGGPAWTYRDKPLPYVPFQIGAGFAARYLWSSIFRGPLSLRPMFIDSLSRADSDDVQIAVERIHGPVLLASGGDDRKWPSALMSARAMERLRQNHHPYPDEQVSYEGAGHWLPSSYLPTSGLRGRMAEEIGGTPEASARVQAQWWPKLLRFLAEIPSQSGAR